VKVAAELATSRKLPAIYYLVGSESGHKGMNREGGRVCGGQHVAGANLYRIGRGEIQGYGVSIDPLALVLFSTGAWPLLFVLFGIRFVVLCKNIKRKQIHAYSCDRENLLSCLRNNQIRKAWQQKEAK
jgi:hypothetical protein